MLPFDYFSQDMMGHFLPGQQAMQIIAQGQTIEQVAAAGALSPLVPTTDLSVDATKAYTLADGPAGVSGITKVVRCISATNTPLGTLTIASPETAAGMVTSATFVFHAAGQMLFLEWSGSKWRCVKTIRAGVKIATVGATALTGFHLCNILSLSVTGTVSSVGANAVPNGQYPGDYLVIGESVAGGTPIGNINFTGLTLANVAATDLQAFGALTDTVTLQWNGVAWVVIANVGVTVA